MREKIEIPLDMTVDDFDYTVIRKEIEKKTEEYLRDSHIECVVMGISGGIDSGLNAVILRNICNRLDIPFYGRYIYIDSNKPEEKERADAIGKCFCTDYKDVDLTKLYTFAQLLFELTDGIETNDHNIKVRRGNIKARLRMLYLYNLAQRYNGIVLDNDNMTEHLLGFWTLHGDVGDVTPLSDLLKTEVYALAKEYLNIIDDEAEKTALQSVIDAVPTDGLGITSSDVEQFGVSGYDVVDDALVKIMHGEYDLSTINEDKPIDRIYKRHKRSVFKRNHPYKIHLD